jgi:hypothetical protein
MLVHLPSYPFVLLNGLTCVLTYAKVEGELFFFTWQMTLAPTFLYLIIQTLIYLKKVIVMDESTYKEVYSIKINRFQLLDSFFHLVLTLLLLFKAFYIAYMLDVEEEPVSSKPLFAAVALYMIVNFAYTYSAKSFDKDNSVAEKKDGSLFTSVMSPILNFLGSSFVLCGGGSCSTIYGSTISAIFSAFGISISEWLPFLDWLTFLLVLVSVGVLYYAKKDLSYKPFLLSCVAAIIIFSDQLFLQMRWPVYIGNVLMVTAALWNSRLNKGKFMFGGGFKKKTTPKPSVESSSPISIV